MLSFSPAHISAQTLFHQDSMQALRYGTGGDLANLRAKLAS